MLIKHSYIGVPVDIGPKMIPKSSLQKPLDMKLPANDASVESSVASEIIELLKSRKDPVIVVDGGECAVWKV